MNGKLLFEDFLRLTCVATRSMAPGEATALTIRGDKVSMAHKTSLTLARAIALAATVCVSRHRCLCRFVSKLSHLPLAFSCSVLSFVGLFVA